MLQNNWRLRNRPDLGAMNSANRLMRELDCAQPDALPNLRGARRLLVGSDYSGQHATSQFEAFGYLVANADKLQPWIDARHNLREKLLPDGRRMSYKSLGDKRRAAALPVFLDSTGLIDGLLLVVLFDKKLGALFKLNGKINTSDQEIKSLAHWPVHVIEKLLRICHSIAFVLAGLSAERQDVIWITDQDDIVANVDRHGELVAAFGNILSHYLDHDLGHIRVATTESDTGKRDLEDFVAIADIAAGAVCEGLNAYRRVDMSPVPGLVLPIPAQMSEKARHLMRWFSNKDSKLKRLVLSFEPGSSSEKLRVRHYDFTALHGVV